MVTQKRLSSRPAMISLYHCYDLKLYFTQLTKLKAIYPVTIPPVTGILQSKGNNMS